MLLRFDRNRIRLILCAFLITTVFEWTDFAFFYIKVITISLILSFIFSARTGFSNRHMPSFAYVHPCIFIKLKLFFFCTPPCVICGFNFEKEGFVCDEAVAIDATHFECRDRSTPQEKKPTHEPKKRGRKPKAEQEAFQLEVQERENQKSIYEKTIEAQLPISLETFRTEAPLEPNWGIKKNSEGKNTFWFGFKAHLAV